MKGIILATLCLTLALGAVVALAQTTPAPTPPPVTTGTKGSTLKIDGRIFVGLFDTEQDAAYPNRSIDIPDAKLRFTFTPAQNIVIVNRFSNNKAGSGGLDYLYVDLQNWGGSLPGHTLRVGKFKIDVGEETFMDNPVENILIMPSVAAVSGYDEGMNFRGPLKFLPTGSYSVGVYNGTKGVDVSGSGLALSGKISAVLLKNLYVSASVYDTGELVLANGTVAGSDIKIANLTSAPTGATSWSRSLWEVDARWNYGATGVKVPFGDADVPFQVATAYGQFSDDVVGAADREGSYWLLEGLYNITKKFYVASRYSIAELDDDATAKLADSTVAVNEYKRFSIGAGYRLNPNMTIKAELSNNSTDGGASEPKLNQLALGIATKF